MKLTANDPHIHSPVPLTRTRPIKDERFLDKILKQIILDRPQFPPPTTAFNRKKYSLDPPKLPSMVNDRQKE